MSSEDGLRLEVIAGNAAGSEILVEDELVIGRQAEGAGRLSEDSEISRQHAHLAREASGDYSIEDLGSSNGTFVNGLRLAAPQLLAEGDSIEVGATTLLVRSIPAKAQAAQTAPSPPPPGAAATIFARAPVSANPAGEPDSTARHDGDGDDPALVEQGEGLPAPASAPSPGEAPALASQAPPLTLVLEVDFEARQASIALGEGSEPISLVLEDGRWRARRAGD
jgi:pSer/pThr/pTyr-binding forkhead associated (FHA) protein